MNKPDEIPPAFGPVLSSGAEDREDQHTTWVLDFSERMYKPFKGKMRRAWMKMEQ